MSSTGKRINLELEIKLNMMRKTVIYSLILMIFSLYAETKTLQAQDLNKAMDFYHSKNYEQAIPLFEQAVPVIEKEYGKYDTVYYSRILLYTAISYKNILNFEKAENYFLQCNDIFETINIKENRLYAESCIELANLYVLYDNFSKAEKYNIEAKNIYEVLYGKQHSKYALSCNNLAFLYKETGNFTDAENFYIEAKDIYERLYGKQHPDYASCCINLASLYDIKGNYNKAEQLYIEAKNIEEALYGKQHERYASACNNLAGLYVELGNYKKAEPLYLHSKIIFEQVAGKQTIKYAGVCNNLGQLYSKTGNYQKAEEFFTAAKTIYKILFGKTHSTYLTVCNNLASLYVSNGEYKKAEKLFIEILNNDKIILGNMHPNYASDCNNLAALYYYTGDYKKAEPLYIEAKKIYQTIFGKQHYNYALSCSNLALVYDAEKKYEKAEPLYIEANTVMNLLSVESAKFMSEKERNYYLTSEISNNIDIYNSYFLDREKDNKEFTGIVYNNALNLKAQLLKSTIAIRKSVLQSSDTSLISDYNKMNNIGKILAQQYTLPIEKRRADTEQLEEQENNYEKKLIRKSQTFAEISKFAKVKWQDIEKSLTDEDAAIEFVSFRYHSNKGLTDSILYYALILKKNYEFPKAVFLFEEKHLQKIVHRNPTLSEYQYIKNLYDPKSEKAADLYQLIWKPLENFTQTSHNIYISPSGLLNRISFDALPVDAANLLSDKYKIIYTTSTSEVLNKVGLYQKDIHGSVLFGGIEYEIPFDEMKKNAEKFRTDKNNSEGNFSIKTSNIVMKSEKNDSLTRGVTWNYLPGSLDEVNEIKNVIGKKHIEVKFYKGKEGSEEQFKALEKNAPSVLHVSTHGFYFGNDDESKMIKSTINQNVRFAHSDNSLLRSGFILAGGNRAFQGGTIPEGVEDGVLTALEISQLNFFKTKLVVLSACQTGLGDVKGNEGVYGLQRSFKMAGVEYLLFSLWEVPDKTTKELMSNFYKNWFAGMEVRSAFKKAQNQLKEKYAGVPGAAFAWAAFVLKK